MMMTKTQRERERSFQNVCFQLCLLSITKKVRLLCVVVLIIILLLLFDHFLHLGVGGRIRRAGGIHDVHSPSNDVFEIGRIRGEERGHRDRDGEVHGEFKRLQRKGLCHSVSLSFFLSFFLSLFRHATTTTTITTTTTTTTTTTNASNDVFCFFLETKMHHSHSRKKKEQTLSYYSQNARL